MFEEILARKIKTRRVDFGEADIFTRIVIYDKCTRVWIIDKGDVSLTSSYSLL